MALITFVGLGLLAGILAGLFGLGGGIIIVPILVLLAGFNQQQATVTSLIALLAPVGLGGVYAFYQDGKILPLHWQAGLIISAGMFMGSYFGGQLALHLPELILKRSFCVFLVLVAVKMWLSTIKGS